MDMRCDSVDIATFLGVYGMAATRVNRGNNGHEHNETKQGSIYLKFAQTRLLVVNRSIYVVLIKNKSTHETIYERPAEGWVW